LIIARRENMGDGTQNTAWTAAGYGTTCCTYTEEYDGSSWSVGGAVAIARRGGAGFGQVYAALIAGGNPSTTSSEEYNGSVWSAGGALIIGGYGGAGGGGQGAAFLADLSPGSNTQEYNGVSWKTSENMTRSPATSAGQGYGAGTPSAGIHFGGVNPAEVTCTEEFAGSGIYKAYMVCALTAVNLVQCKKNSV
jgi:hypothetical protein